MSHDWNGKYVSLTSFKRDGTAVATPVWFVAENGHLVVETARGSFKVKRIRRNPNVTVAPCSLTGRLRGEPVTARAEFLPESEHSHVDELMARKYRVDRFVVGVVRRLLGQSPTLKEPVLLQITPH